MPDVCGIVADLRREDQGVYEFKKLTLLGYDAHEPEIKRLLDLGFKVTGRVSPGPVYNFNIIGDRQSITWTCVTDKEATLTIGIVADLQRESEGEYVIPRCTVFGLEREELQALVEKGFKVTDENRRVEGVEISDASPFKVMRVLCRDHGWSTDGEIVQLPAPGER